MNILGVGILFSQGLGIASLEQALQNGWQRPQEVAAPRKQGDTTLAYQVNLDALPDKTLLKKIRRSDKVGKMAVLAAADALRDSGIDSITQKNIGIILATAFGPHVTTFSFLDGVLDFGDAAVSPTAFSNSVHNAAASYITMALNIKGPTLTVSQFRFPFQSALQLAQTWLDQSRCDYVLVGAVDQYGDVLGYVSEQKLGIAADGRIKPFTFKPTCHVPGEGAVFFLLSRVQTANAYCSIKSICINDDSEGNKRVDINIIDANGMMPDESAYRSELSGNIPVTAYAPLFGSMMSGSAFNVATSALMIKKQFGYAAPVQDNPLGLHLLAETQPRSIESIRCIGCDCEGEKAVLYLNKL